ncbi:Protein-tyrosine phosphatase [Teladorsagia circumcincta]|uniref:Protein-tyrosine phosphatase n=1 Tax=Teladorsagia circumcincta TaxID=45464 RepID=A0A2G9UJS5_TELCI|nr:Protein-tyrosine phosphatase [Teladorsagia circumcincta]
MQEAGKADEDKEDDHKKKTDAPNSTAKPPDSTTKPGPTTESIPKSSMQRSASTTQQRRPTMATIRKEFIQNKNYRPSEYTFDYFKRNVPKNRYEDVICVDSTRVVLKERGPDDDYIHASWMDMPDGQKYICTQGPLQETVEDFWHMVFTEKSNVVVMLCCLREVVKFDNSFGKYPFPIQPTKSRSS